METLYRKAICAWGVSAPAKIVKTDRSDDAVFNALVEIVGDIFSPTWERDSRIAWALLQGREV